MSSIAHEAMCGRGDNEARTERCLIDVPSHFMGVLAGNLAKGVIERISCIITIHRLLLRFRSTP